MARRYTAVIFDVDGTLVDSNDLHALSWVDALARHGIDVTWTRVRPLIGMGADKLIPAAAGRELSEREVARIGDDRAALFKERYLPRVRPLRGARALVAQLRALGYAIAIASSAREDELRPLLEIAGVVDLVDVETSSDDADRSKPDPDIVTAAVRRLARAPRDCVMVGDTPYDVAAARRAGVDTIAVRAGGWRDAELHGAIAVVDDPADLLANLGILDR